MNFCAGGIATPADAALMMQLEADGVFVGSGIFKSEDPAGRAKAIVEATTYYEDLGVLPRVSSGLGEAMPGLEIGAIVAENLTQYVAGKQEETHPLWGRFLPGLGFLPCRAPFASMCGCSRLLALRPRGEAPDSAGLDGLVIPGGESTAMGKLMEEYGLRVSVRAYATDHPVFGTCAEIIMLASLPMARGPSLRSWDVTVRRNAFGRQTKSFEAPVDLCIGEGKGETLMPPWSEKSISGRSIQSLLTSLQELNLF